jgi:uncharacterized protein (TIGR03083 family)
VFSASLRRPQPIEVHGLFQPDRDALLELLRSLPADEWAGPTVCPGWDVRDVALHVLGGDLANISRRRDAFDAPEPLAGERLGMFLARQNQQWVEAARRFSPQLIVELFEMVGPLLFSYFSSLDVMAIGGKVSWAGPGPAPVWLDVAREYMERWVHQQHIRDAVGRPGQRDPRFVRPIIAASMHALPIALAEVDAARGQAVTVCIRGDAGGTWSVVREGEIWHLFEGETPAAASLALDAEDWWRAVTLGLDLDSALARARVEGDPKLARAALSAVAIIA